MTISKRIEYEYSHGEESGLSLGDVVAAWAVAAVGTLIALTII